MGNRINLKFFPKKGGYALGRGKKLSKQEVLERLVRLAAQKEEIHISRGTAKKSPLPKRRST